MIWTGPVETEYMFPTLVLDLQRAHDDPGLASSPWFLCVLVLEENIWKRAAVLPVVASRPIRQLVTPTRLIMSKVRFFHSKLISR